MNSFPFPSKMGYFQIMLLNKNKEQTMAFSKTPTNSIVKLYSSTTQILEKVFGPILLLCIRLWMAQIFWYSGRSKIQSWSTTLMLFENEYKVPLLPPDLAAYITATFELTCPILLVLGLG